MAGRRIGRSIDTAYGAIDPMTPRTVPCAMICRFVAMVLLASGCTHVMRDGIAKPDEHSARLRSDGISVDRVDGQAAIRELGSTILSP